MEGFLESFLYLFITIVILVLSMRKKKPAQPLPDEETQSDDPFAELFRDEEDEDYEPERQLATVTGTEGDDKAQSTPWMSESDARDMVIDADAVIREAATNNPIAEYEGRLEEDAYEIGSGNDEGIPFDLKKAVIYSVIIERRAFQEY